MLPDLLSVFVWWLAIFLIGLVFFPLTKRVFGKFFDQGYLFSKVLGILFSSYVVWLLASLKILPFYQETIWLVLVIGLLVNLILSRKKTSLSTSHPRLTFHLSPSLLIFVAEELMFFFALAFWSYIRALQPDIQGLEKFMDFGFVNSILRSKYFPPADMWFAGKSINYYYFGHYVTAFLTKLTNIDSAVTYNLMLATLFAFTFSLTFSLTGNLLHFFKSNLKLVIFGGLISAFLISLGANLHPAYYNFQMGILKKPYCDGATTYWYPNATRYIGYCPNVEDKTIHEFPSYSFTVSDLHGHVSDIPFVLLFLAMALNLFIKIKESKEKTFNFSLLTFHLLISMILAIMYMTNQWDFPIYLTILGFTLLLGFYQVYGKNYKTLINAAILGGIILLLSIPFFLPFQLNFENIAKGVGFVRTHSLFYQLLILWGGPWFFGASFLLFLFGKKIKISFNKESLIKRISNTLGVEVQFKKLSSPTSRSSFTPPTSHLLPTDIFVLILLAVSTLLVIVPEIIYLKDIYIPSFHRANTMFKLTYQSFILFSICTGYILVRIHTSMKKSWLKKTLFIVHCSLFIALMVYPFYSIRGYYGNLSAENYKGLYGLKFLQRLYPDDYQVILWLNRAVPGQPVVLEAVGDSYTDYERVSMATGLPTIEGWLVHEWLWRGSFDEPGKRSSEVQTIYESKDLELTKNLLKKYKVKYVVIGDMEKEKYPKLNEEKFQNLGKKVFESGKTAVWELI